MLKLMSLMKRKEGMSKEDFRTWITEDHPGFAKELPGLRKYIVNVTVDDDDFPYDAVNELYFDSEEARAAAFASEFGAAAGGDAAGHAGERVHLRTVEHIIVSG